MTKRPIRKTAEPVSWIFAVTKNNEKTKIGYVYLWNTGEETQHFIADIPNDATLHIEPIEIEASKDV